MDTAAQPNVTSLGTLTSLVANTVDLNGGTLDSVVIGANVSSTANFTNLTASNLQASSLIVQSADIDSGVIDGTVIGSSSPHRYFY